MTPVAALPMPERTGQGRRPQAEPAPAPRTRIAAAVRLLPGIAALFTFGVLARGGFASFASFRSYELTAALLLLGGTALAGVRRWRRGVALLRDELELGGCVLAATFATVALAGERTYPIVYLVSAFLVTFFSRPAALTLLGAAVLFDAQSTLATRPSAFLAHTVFLGAFAALYHVVLSARLAAARKAEAEAVKNRLREVEERARTFRLATSGSRDSSPSIADKEKWILASVKEIEGALGTALEIAELSLRSHTCAVFLLGSDDRSLKLHDCRSASDRVQRDRLPAGEGIFGAMLKRGVPMRLVNASGVKGVTHYEAGAPTPCAVLAVPIVEAGGLTRGVLVADRLTADAFTEADERLLGAIASEVLRSVEVERVMGYIRSARDEKDRFFRAIEELNRAGSPDQVFLAVLESAKAIAPLDFCAVTLVADDDKGQRSHRIARMTGVTAQGRALEGRSFADNNGLVANVVRYGAPLPGREVMAMDRQVIFDGDTQVRGLQSLKIFPLVAGDRILGTLVAGSRKKSAIDGEAWRMLEVMAIQAAQAVLRAQLFEQMERMATTDGLTSLLNHRTFQVRCDEALAAARRYGRKCSLILTDIDHFKSVNDTWGHPTGDLVLKGVAKILKDKARDTDIVARYGGEEFAIIMPETDTKGALVIAERIREAVMAEVFQSEQGPLKVTLSLGIATFPDVAQEKQSMVDLADQCLYFAKRHGRNQSVTVSQLQGQKRAG